MDLLDGFFGAAQVADVFGVGDGLVGQAQDALEQDVVQLDDVELRPGAREISGCSFALRADDDGFGFGREEMIAVREWRR